MKKDYQIRKTQEQNCNLSCKENSVFARTLSRKLTKNEQTKVSGGRNTKVVCYDTYIGGGIYYPDCTVE